MLISDDYRKMQKSLHKNSNYGSTSELYADLINKHISTYGFKEILDYGAGKCRLKTRLSNIKYNAYEPSNDLYSNAPDPCQFVVSIDVLEHIEPDCLENVLDDLKRVTVGYGFFTIHTKPAKKKLPDGRNAHLIQQNMEWWLPKLKDRFDIITKAEQPNRCEFFVKVKEWDGAIV